MRIDPPLALLAELTHRCPLRCPYCSNPLGLVQDGELSTAAWQDVLAQAAGLGILHVHFSGGEPLVRRDLEQLVAAARSAGLFSNLITSGLGLPGRLGALVAAGLGHVQVSIQDVTAEGADLIAGRRGVVPAKLEAARAVRRAGLPLTVNTVVHRHNLARIPR